MLATLPVTTGTWAFDPSHSGVHTPPAKILRDDFGIDFNMPLGIDKFALGKKIDVEIDVQFTAPQ